MWHCTGEYCTGIAQGSIALSERVAIKQGIALALHWAALHWAVLHWTVFHWVALHWAAVSVSEREEEGSKEKEG